jgi:hypothetical protein
MMMDKAWLEGKYIKENLNIQQIADIYTTDCRYLYNRLARIFLDVVGGESR